MRIAFRRSSLDGVAATAEVGAANVLIAAAMTRQVALTGFIVVSSRRVAVTSLDALISAKPGPLLIAGLLALGWQLSDSMPELSLRVHSRAAGLADRLGDTTLRRLTTGSVASQMAYQGRFDEAVEMCKPLLHQSADTIDLAEIEWVCGLWLMCGGRFEEARAVFEGTLTRLGDPRLALATWADAARDLGEVFLVLGKWDLAQDLSDHGTDPL